MKTANAGENGISGALEFRTGTSSSGSTGTILLQTGAANGGKGGDIKFGSGEGNAGIRGGDVVVLAGKTTCPSPNSPAARASHKTAPYRKTKRRKAALKRAAEIAALSASTGAKADW